MNRLTACVVLVAAPFAAIAHHSNAEYDFGVIEEYEGEILDVSWRNPHVRMSLRSVRDDGTEVIWDLEAQAANTLTRRGLSPEQIGLGDIVRVAGHPSRRRDSMYLTNVLLTDGTEIRTRGDTEPRWSTEHIGFDPRVVETSPGDDAGLEGIYRVWMPAERVRNTDLPLNATARAAKESWDPVTDDPQIGCRPIGMPGAMFSPHPIEFVRDGEDMTLRLEEWEAERTIHMSPDPGTRSAPATRMGYAVGRWEGDTLVVTTTNIEYPYMDEQGTPQSDSVEVVERFTLSADERTLDWEATVTDPGTMTEPVVAFTTRWEWIPGEALQPYNCAVH